MKKTCAELIRLHPAKEFAFFFLTVKAARSNRKKQKT